VERGAADAPVPLSALAEAGVAAGVLWALAPRPDGDLNANLVGFACGAGVGEHVNDECDVLVVGVSGAGLVRVDDVDHRLAPGDLLLVPRGARRETEAVSARFAYLTVHRRRGPRGLVPARPD
jgi:quercetin dioxygenase-like cupin family protein